MRISDASHHLKKTSLWENENQPDAETDLTTPDILSKATATIRASFGANNPQDIWDALGLHLQKQLVQRNAVKITDFGMFGINENDEPIFVQDPVFLHMTRLCLASRKHGNRIQPVLAQSASVASIDLSELTAEYLQNCSKDLVKSVILSVLACVAGWAKDGQEMRLSFLPVGEWICDGDSVEVKFSESFCKELKINKMKPNVEEEGTHSVSMEDNHNHNVNNQIFEDQDQAGYQSTVSPRSTRNVEGIKKLNSHLPNGKLAVAASLSDIKEAVTRNGSPVSRSRYKLRAPTSSSIAKQLPPHGQRRNRADAKAKGPNSNSSTKATHEQLLRNSRAMHPNRAFASPAINSCELEAAAKEIVDAVKNSRPVASSSRACEVNKRSRSASQLTAQHMEIISRLRKRLSNRRSKLMQGLNAVVAVLSPFKTGVISSTELSLSLRKQGIKISSAELKEIAVVCAHEKRGYVDTRKLLDALRGPPLSAARLDLVARVFHQMDPACSGSVHIDELIKHYDVSFLPQVRDGKQSRLEALSAFLQGWACLNNAATNSITLETFTEYYHNVSACIGDDADFARLIHQAWRIPEEIHVHDGQSRVEESSKNVSLTTSAGAPEEFLPSFGTTENILPAAKSVTGIKAIKEEVCPSEAWSYLRTLLLSPHRHQDGVQSWPTLDNMCCRLGANRVLGDGNETMNIKAFAYALVLLDKRLQYKNAYQLAYFVATHCGKGLGGSDTIVLLSLYRLLVINPDEPSTKEPSVDYNYVEYCASRAIERIRERVKGFHASNNKAGCSSLVDLTTLEKCLQVSISNGDSLLLKYELRSGLQKVGIDITYQDLDYLFAYFDNDRQGFINYKAFMEALRSPSSALPKRPEKAVTTPDYALASTSAHVQPSTNWATSVPSQPVRLRRQLISREPQPNFRRRNLIHRAIWDQTARPTATDAAGNLHNLEIERRRRYRAAQLIQTTFRGFRARQIVAQIRRRLTAKNYHSKALAQEHQQWLVNKKKTYRTAQPTAYSF